MGIERTRLKAEKTTFLLFGWVWNDLLSLGARSVGKFSFNLLEKSHPAVAIEAGLSACRDLFG